MSWIARVALAVGLALACGGEPPAGPVVEAPPEPPPAPTPVSASDASGLPERYLEIHRLLESEEVLMEWKHEIVEDQLAPDPSPDATLVLILATENASIPISMASLRTLPGRDDPRVEPQLRKLLEDPAWQRRAWAARALGEVRQASSLGALQTRLALEPDERVVRQLEGAIAALSGVAEAGEPVRDSEGTGG